MIPEACLKQDELLNAVLDGERPADVLRNDHTRDCARCRAFVSLAPMMSLSPIAPPAFVPRVVVEVRSRTIPTRRRLHAAVGVLAASVLLVIGKVGTREKTSNRTEIAVVELKTVEVPAPSMDGRTALAELKRGLNEQVYSAKATLALPPIVPREPDSTLAGEALAAVPESARASLEPIAGTTRRAFSMFLRELPSLPREAVTTP